MDSAKHPVLYPLDGPSRPRKHRKTIKAVCYGAAALLVLSQILLGSGHTRDNATPVPIHYASTLARCENLHTTPGPPANFHSDRVSDRYVNGTRPILIQDARIWTGLENGTDVVRGDILLDKGVIQSVGHLHVANLHQKHGSDLQVINARGAWITPGIVDIHSHMGDDPSPELRGSDDTNSLKATIQPNLRSLDGLNTHDDSFRLSVSGGVTTSLVLPGSANAIGGQAYVIKLRPTAERSPTSMLLEPPYQINGSSRDHGLPPRWRYMKHACGENPHGVYGDTRMDTMWKFREAYAKAVSIKDSQDAYCAKAISNNWKDLGDFPEDLEWEALVDAVRGRVKIQIHCYEAVDLDDMVRLSNEFKFPISAFHHASEAFLVPDVLKRAYGHTPAIALFATNGRYKREAYRASEFAPHILSQHGIDVMMKSDHPVLNSRYLLYEAQQAHYYGLTANLALAAVTSTSARTMGLDHRIGFIKAGWDADLVIWDSHPLALGATPTQVIIDGMIQLESPHIITKPDSFQTEPKVPTWEKETAEAVKYDGLPPLTSSETLTDIVVFTNVNSVYITDNTGDIAESLWSSGAVIVRSGKVDTLCPLSYTSCNSSLTAADLERATIVDLDGGSIAPGLVSFGAPLGLQEIDQEKSTNDGYVLDPLKKPVSSLLGGDESIIRAVDGLQFATRDALLAYRAGVTSAITAPSHKSFYAGLGTSFSLGVSHKLETGAIIQEVTAVHVSVLHFGSPSVSTQIAALRQLLLGPQRGEAGRWFHAVTKGRIPLVVEAHSADIIATLCLLKEEVEDVTGNRITLTITGASEAHLLAKELSKANVGIVINPPRPFPYVWEDKRILPGPPLSELSAIATLLSYNVTVGVGIEEIWSARNSRFDVAWAAIEAGGKISKKQAMGLAGNTLEKLLGGEVTITRDLVATSRGDLLSFESKIVGVISAKRSLVDMFL